MTRYERYKPSGIEWIGDIPEHWILSKIKYTAKEGMNNFQDGDWIESNVIVEEGDYRYITTGNIGEGKYRDQGRSFISLETFKKLECLEIFPDDMLISRLNPPIGRSCIIPNLGFRIVTSVDNVVLRPKQNIEKKFLVYLTNSEHYYEYTGLIARGATMARISRTLLGSVEIPLPPLSEQTAIASYLDQKIAHIDNLIANKQKLIELLKEERMAIINEAVSGEGKNWERKKLKYIVTKVGSGVTPTGGANVYLDEGIPLLRSQNIYSDGLVLDDVAYISDEIDEQMSNSRIQEDDVLLNITGASIGRCFYVPKNFGSGNVNQHVCIIRPITTKIKTRFLHLFLISSYGQTLIDICQNGANREGLNFQQIKSFEVPLPVISEQEKIISKIEIETQRTKNTILKIEKEIELMQEYRIALISEVVTGKIKVN